MPIVAIDLTEEEVARVDTVADREKRVRKAQVHILTLIGPDAVESQEAKTKEDSEA